MKPLRLLLKNSAIALLSILTLSCVDNTYDLSDLSTEAKLFRNSLSAPVGTATIVMDSIIGGMDLDSSNFKYQNGMYVFNYSDKFEMGDISKTLNDFKLSSLTGFTSTVPLYDASVLPPNTPLPFNLFPGKYEYSTPVNVDLPAFSTSIIDLDSISLQNTKIKITVTEDGLAGNNLDNSLSIKFENTGTGVDYYNGNDKITTWTVQMNHSITLDIKKLRVKDEKFKLEFLPTVLLNVVKLGDVQAKALVQTKMNIIVEYPTGIDYNMVWGKVHYVLPQKEIKPIQFKGLEKIISENDVLSIYEPKIILKTDGNIGAPIDVNLDVTTTNTKNGKTSPGLTDATFHINPASDTLDHKKNSITLGRENGTSELFKINPDLIELSYSAKTVNKPGESYFIAKNSWINMSYDMEIPLQFDKDLKMSVDTTLENPFKDNLDKLENQKDLNLALALNIKNRIPLKMQIELEALDANFDSLFTVQTAPIEAATTLNGLATGETITNTEITLTTEQINRIKDTKMFHMKFLVTSKQDEKYVTVQKKDYITIKIGGKINGGVLIDLSSGNSKN